MSAEAKHTYPSRYPPGSHWAVTEAWEILDTIKPGIIPDDVRSFLAGAIAGRLMKMQTDNENKVPVIKLNSKDWIK